MADKGLGRGLGALLGLQDDVGEELTQMLPIAKIEPKADQPRRQFDEDALEKLSESIKQHGMLQPLTVRPREGGYYQIILGERRWRAARMAGLAEVPAMIIQADDKKAMELALIENLQREDLNPLEEAEGYRSLINVFGLTQEEVSRRVGISRPAVANTLRLLSLPDGAKKLLEEGKLTSGHARALMQIEDPQQLEAAAAKVAAERLSVRQAEQIGKRLSSKPGRTDSGNKNLPDYIAPIEEQLTARLGRRVRIKHGRMSGRFEIDYYGPEDFELLREALAKLELG